MVVLSMLTLFAIVGITFVLYATAEANSTNAGKQSEKVFAPDIEPEVALAMFLGQAIYGVPDPTSNNGPPFSFSALRGHELARLMYGYSGAGGQDNMAFNGVGRFDLPLPTSATLGTNTTTTFNSTSYLVNFQPFLDPTTKLPKDGFLFDPERYSSTVATNNGARSSTAPDTTSTYIGGANVPYTFPDHQNMFLATVRSDGTVLMPSFHRPWLFGSWTSTNTNTTNNIGKYLTCFVRPNEMGTGFPVPDANGLSVKNLGNSPGSSFNYGGTIVATGNDSGWIDIGAPVITAPNGQKYKMLVAPLIMELDSKLDLNTIANIIGQTSAGAWLHASDQGWGPSEVNMSKVLNSGVAPNEWQNIFLGNAYVPKSPATNGVYSSTSSQRNLGRYGTTCLPIGPVSGGTSARGWAPVDYDSVNDKGGLSTTNPPGPTANALTMLFPYNNGAGTPYPYQIFPNWDSNFYNNGNPTETQDSLGNVVHPLAYNAWRPLGDNRRLALSSLMSLYRLGDTNVDTMSSDLFRLCPQNFLLDKTAPNLLPNATGATGGTTALTPTQRRLLTTLLSADLNRPAATPYIFDPSDSVNNPFAVPAPATTTRYVFPQTYNSTNQRYELKGTTIGQTFPSGQNPVNYPVASAAGVTSFGSTSLQGDFNPTTYRSLLARVGKVDLNRKLSDYPTPNASGVIDMTLAANVTQYNQALADRQQFAADLFLALRQATGAMDPSVVFSNLSLGPLSDEYKALRYLAQIAVNIVDYIDYDDYITPFNWDPSNTNAPPGSPTAPSGWVFGTEMPRLLINEFYASCDNDPTETGPPAAHYYTNVWVELYNPFSTESVPNSGYNALPDKQAILHNGGTTGPNYTIVLAAPVASVGSAMGSILRDPANVLGDPDFGVTAPATNYLNKNLTTSGAAVGVQDWIPTGSSYSAATNGDFRQVLPSNNAFAGSTSMNGTVAVPNVGFYVIGPTTTSYPAGRAPNFTATSVSTTRTEMGAASLAATFPTTVQPTILLRRLLCPGLAPQPDPTKANYNPYITIDYTEVNNTLPPGNGTATSLGTLGPLWDSRNYDTAARVPAALNSYYAFGRFQPLSGTNLNQQQRGQITNDTTAGRVYPLNTFMRTNSYETAPPIANPTATGQIMKVPFDWLVHLDRQLVSPMELLHVSGYKPHELTQQFYDATQTLFGHRVPWWDTNTRLLRFLELVETRNRAAGMAAGGRVPGKINGNGVNDQEVYQALADTPSLAIGQGANYFTQYDVLAVHNQMMLSRNNTGSGIYTGFEQPFWGLAVGAAAGSGNDAMTPMGMGSRGLRNSLLRPAYATNYGPWPALAAEPSNFLPGPFPVTAATNAKPIQITSPNHGLKTGQVIFISGCLGNTAANNGGTSPAAWQVNVIDNYNFTIFDAATGNPSDGTSAGAYTGSGTWIPSINAGVPGPFIITQATNAKPIQITSPNHNLRNGQVITITGCMGNVAANNNTAITNPPYANAGTTPQQWAVTIIDQNNFTLSDGTVPYPTGTPSDGTTAPGQTAMYSGGGTWMLAITADTGATPIQLTSQNHGLFTGQLITVLNVGGDTNANGNWIVTVPLLPNGTPDPNNFNLSDPTTGQPLSGSGAYVPNTGSWVAPRPHPFPYRRFELLNKIYNNMTTRSNVFAVWLTCGFFEVVKDPTTGLPGDSFTPVKLGAEIGSAEGRQVRHRMFAIIDRTQVQVFNTALTRSTTAFTGPSNTGTGSNGTITQATNAAPIQITSTGHGLNTGQWVTITSVPGNLAANGTWCITVIDANNFVLNGSTGNGAYTAPTPPATYAGLWSTINGPQPIQVASYSGTNPNTGRNWAVQQDTVLTVDPNINGNIISIAANSTTPTLIQITSPNHGLVSGQTVAVDDQTSNSTGAKGRWVITVLDVNNFTLNGSTFLMASTNKGVWSTDAEETVVVQATGGPITNATNAAAAPGIQITSANHGLHNGQTVVISGVQGNTSANNTAASPFWTVTVVDVNNFTLTNPTGGAPVLGNGVYTGGGGWLPAVETASNASPIQITATNHGLYTGQVVTISGCQGNTAANGTWVITVPTLGTGGPDPNNFTLNGSSGNAAYTGGGTWFTRNAVFQNTHASGVGVINRGNPGPWIAPNGIVTSATGSGVSPISITSPNHGLTTGDLIIMSGVLGNTAANGSWVVTVVDSNTFTLNGGTGNGAYVSGGTWYAYAKQRRYDPRKDPLVVPFFASVQ
jgi:hypothetical protein